MLRCILSIVFIVFILSGVRSQTGGETKGRSLAKLLNEISTVKWRQDSMGTQGYREKWFGELENAIPDNTTEGQLLAVLGRPSVQRIFQLTTEYQYYLMDFKHYQEHPLFDHPYLVFTVDSVTKRITSVRKDFLCF